MSWNALNQSTWKIYWRIGKEPNLYLLQKKLTCLERLFSKEAVKVSDVSEQKNILDRFSQR